MGIVWIHCGVFSYVKLQNVNRLLSHSIVCFFCFFVFCLFFMAFEVEIGKFVVEKH